MHSRVPWTAVPRYLCTIVILCKALAYQRIIQYQWLAILDNVTMQSSDFSIAVDDTRMVPASNPSGLRSITCSTPLGHPGAKALVECNSAHYLVAMRDRYDSVWHALRWTSSICILGQRKHVAKSPDSSTARVLVAKRSRTRFSCSFLGSSSHKHCSRTYKHMEGHLAVLAEPLSCSAVERRCI